jgi:lipopolysaccharide/colanic/teichoic acid biosynthesis glycosyltransferase
MREKTGKTTWKPLLSARGKHGIYGERELRELIVYERARADRTGDKLSVVLCGMNGQSGSRRFVNQAIHTLSRSIRHTDHLGWYDRKCLGVVLPLTSHGGAKQFVQSLLAMPDNGQRNVAAELEFSIHSYPDKWLADDEALGARPGGKDAGLYFTNPVPQWKRVLDVVGSVAGLIVLSPLFALLALYIKLISPGPVFFRQKRVGLARKEFDFYKFRTMHVNNEEEVHSHHAKDFIHFDKPMTKLDGIDPRIIKGGRILRKLAVDELPQLWNILKGDMTLVGPRPCIPYEADEYLQWHTDRFSILPGLTGLWQVSGKNKLSFQQMIRLDIDYARRMSLWFDLWIIAKTIPTVIGLGIEGTAHRLRVRESKRQEKGEQAPVYELADEPQVRRIAK